MNKRQKKKWIKQNVVRVKKIRPSEQDIVFFVPDFDRIDIDTVVEFYNCCIKTGMFEYCGCAIVPCNIKKMNVDTAQLYIDEIQKEINKVKKKNN